jgi:homoaconitate hydratase
MFFATKRYLKNQTLIEKIVQRHIVEKSLVYSGDYVTIKPRHVMTHDNTSAVMSKFAQFKNAKIKNVRQPVFTLDHNVQDKTPDNMKKYQKIADFAKLHCVDAYPAGRGIGHQIMCEEGYAWPLSMAVASDSHSNVSGHLSYS